MPDARRQDLRLLAGFTEAVALRDGKRLAKLFTENGTYADCFYGVAKGRKEIAHLINEQFFSTADDFRWTFHDPVRSKDILYARYAFSYCSKISTAPDRRVGFEGVSILSFRGKEIESYREVANTGPMLASLGYAPEHLVNILLKDDARVWSLREFDHHRNG